MDVNIKESFQRAIKNGTGEAILILNKFPDENLDNIINEACMRNLAYDPQCEGTRSEYLIEIISHAKNKTQIIKNISSGLCASKDDNWDTHQLIELSKHLALAGNEKAKQSLYDRYKKNLNPEFDFVETEALVEVDGFDGLCFSMKVIGEYLESTPDFWVDDILLSCFKENFPTFKLEKHIREVASSNKYIKTYLASEDVKNWFDNSDKTIKSNGKTDYSYKHVAELIRTGKRLPITVGKRMSPEDIAKLANDFEQNNNTEIEESYLRAFAYAKYSGNIKHVASFLYSNNERKSHYAVSILSKIQDDSIRLIIDNTSIKFLKDKIRLLVSNYRKRDIKLLLDICEKTQDEDEIHSFVSDVITVFENNKIEKPSVLLDKIYRINNCSLCRESMVEILISSNDLSEGILEELLFDSDLDIRKLAINYRKEHSN